MAQESIRSIGRMGDYHSAAKKCLIENERHCNIEWWWTSCPRNAVVSHLSNSVVHIHERHISSKGSQTTTWWLCLFPSKLENLNTWTWPLIIVLKRNTPHLLNISASLTEKPDCGIPCWTFIDAWISILPLTVLHASKMNPALLILCSGTSRCKSILLRHGQASL